MKEELISELPTTQNRMFILFLFCFFAYVQLLTKRSKSFFAMLNDLLLAKREISVLYQKVGIRMTWNIFLSIQTVVLSSIAIYCILLHLFDLKFKTNTQLFVDLIVISLFVVAYILYKFLLTILIGSVFFQKTDIQLWSNYFFSILSLCGLCLFIPVLLMFYLENAYYFCFYFVLGCFFLTEVLILNESYIFFYKKSPLYYFILNFCIQAVIPLYLFFKIVVCFAK